MMSLSRLASYERYYKKNKDKMLAKKKKYNHCKACNRAFSNMLKYPLILRKVWNGQTFDYYCNPCMRKLMNKARNYG